jgi:phosphate transport system protein
MSQHIVKSYDEELNGLKTLLVDMTKVSLDQLDRVYRSVSKHDLSSLPEVIKQENILNNLDDEITTLSLNILSLRNPVALDLRFVFAASHISRNLERIGDNARNVANSIEKIENKNDKLNSKIMEMIHISTEMLHSALDAFQNRNHELALNIMEKDILIDNLHHEISKSTLAKIQSQPGEVQSFHIYLLMCRYVERIGDHIVNICRYLYFIEKNKLSFRD